MHYISAVLVYPITLNFLKSLVFIYTITNSYNHFPDYAERNTDFTSGSSCSFSLRWEPTLRDLKPSFGSDTISESLHCCHLTEERYILYDQYRQDEQVIVKEGIPHLHPLYSFVLSNMKVPFNCCPILFGNNHSNNFRKYYNKGRKNTKTNWHCGTEILNIIFQ